MKFGQDIMSSVVQSSGVLVPGFYEDYFMSASILGVIAVSSSFVSSRALSVPGSSMCDPSEAAFGGASFREGSLCVCLP